MLRFKSMFFLMSKNAASSQLSLFFQRKITMYSTMMSATLLSAPFLPRNATPMPQMICMQPSSMPCARGRRKPDEKRIVIAKIMHFLYQYTCCVSYVLINFSTHLYLRYMNRFFAPTDRIFRLFYKAC
jgi:hypothetical protein